jgi:hypothetical protein
LIETDLAMLPVKRPKVGREFPICSVSFATARHPSGKLIAIDEALPTARIAPAKLSEVRDLRQKAYGLTASGKLAEAHDVADRALQILGVEWKPELGGPPTRC